jgi:hypothetical protein
MVEKKKKTYLLKLSQELLELGPVVDIYDPGIPGVKYFLSKFLVYLI